MNVFKMLSQFRKTSRQMMKFNRRKHTRGWIFLSLLGLGAISGTIIGRNPNMMKAIRQFFQGKVVAMMPPRLNTAMMEFAEEITPSKPKKYSHKG